MKMIEDRKRHRGQSGFTLIELLVVIAILAILAGVAVFAVGNLNDDAGLSACQIEKRTAKTAKAASDASAATDTYLTFMDGTPKYVTGVSGTGNAITVTLAGTAPAGC